MNTLGRTGVGLVAGALALGLEGASVHSAHAAAWFNCLPTAVFEVGASHGPQSSELQVSCSNSYSGPSGAASWIALPQAGKTDALQARFISMATSALLSGKAFRVYMTDTVCPGFSSGCYVPDSWSIYTP